MMCNQTCLFSARVITLYHSKQKKQSKLASFFMQRITHFSKPTKEKKKDVLQKDSGLTIFVGIFISDQKFPHEIPP